MIRDLVYGRNAVREALRGRRSVLEVWVGERAAATLEWLSEGPKPRVRRERELTEAASSSEEIAAQSESWPLLLPEAKLEADKIHVFRDGLTDLGAVRFVWLNIIPDGGVSRLRLIGRVVR